MKKTKRLAALFLALMMSLSLLAVTASAYGVEEHTHDEECCDAVIARSYAGYCPICGADASYYVVTTTGGVRVAYWSCPNCGDFTDIL